KRQRLGVLDAAQTRLNFGKTHQSKPAAVTGTLPFDLRGLTASTPAGLGAISPCRTRRRFHRQCEGATTMRNYRTERTSSAEARGSTFCGAVARPAPEVPPGGRE